MRAKPVAISKLASFAADPAQFGKDGGRPQSQRAAEYGIEHHDSIGRSSASKGAMRKLVSAVIILGALAVIVLLLLK